MVLDKFDSNNSSMVTALDKSKQEVDDWNEKWGSGLAVQVGAGAASGGTPSDVVESIVACNARTGCQPEFEETEMPIDTMKDFIFLPDCVLAKADFESNHEVLACATSLINEKVLVYITKSWKLFLVNTGDGDVSLNAGEVFGFNLGAFQEKPTGVAKSERRSSDSIPDQQRFRLGCVCHWAAQDCSFYCPPHLPGCITVWHH